MNIGIAAGVTGPSVILVVALAAVPRTRQMQLASASCRCLEMAKLVTPA